MVEGQFNERVSKSCPRLSPPKLISTRKVSSMENGLLHIDLVREIPEELKPRTIEINKGKLIENKAA